MDMTEYECQRVCDNVRVTKMRDSKCDGESEMVTFSNAVLSHRLSETTKATKKRSFLTAKLRGKGSYSGWAIVYTGADNFLSVVAKLQKCI